MRRKRRGDSERFQASKERDGFSGKFTKVPSIRNVATVLDEEPRRALSVRLPRRELTILNSGEGRRALCVHFRPHRPYAPTAHCGR
mmetsp:Transcript_11737/g.38618  ORF Transcript_11737/g.38618 Transcript_11737/m.38618 type:complete len:86 (-) Transcript_11737:414-671(-)